MTLIVFAGVFDTNKLLESEQGRVTHVYRSIYDKLFPLTDKCDPTDQAEAAIVDTPRGYHTGSSQHASAESEIEPDDLIDVQRMSLGPSGAAHLRDRVETIKIKPRSTTARVKEETNLFTQGHLQAYLEEAWECFQQNQREQAYQAIYPSQRIKAYTPDVEMESVRSTEMQSDIFDPEDADPDESGQEERRRAMVATTETLQNGGAILQHIRV